MCSEYLQGTIVFTVEEDRSAILVSPTIKNLLADIMQTTNIPDVVGFFTFFENPNYLFLGKSFPFHLVPPVDLILSLTYQLG